MYVCLSVCHKRWFFFCVSRWHRAIFWLSVLHVALYKTLFFDFLFRPLMPKIYSSKFGTKSPISWLVWQIDRRCLGLLGGFRGWPIQWNHAKCCGADPCCHGNEILTHLAFFCKKIACKLACMADRPDMFWPTRGANPCCHGNDIWARRGDLVAYRLVN